MSERAGDYYTSEIDAAADAVPTEDTAEIDAATAADLRAAVEVWEAVNWREVPTISVATAAYVNERLRAPLDGEQPAGRPGQPTQTKEGDR